MMGTREGQTDRGVVPHREREGYRLRDSRYTEHSHSVSFSNIYSIFLFAAFFNEFEIDFRLFTNCLQACHDLDAETTSFDQI